MTYEPEHSWGGYNIILYKRRIPALIDMNGRLVHSWPSVRASGRAKLQPNGHLALITDEGDFEELDWDGRVAMSFSAGRRRFFHHDFTRLQSGNYLLLAHGFGNPGYDYFIEVDRSGKELWRWDSRDHLREEARRRDPPVNLPHINSVQELPENRWFEAGHEEFRPGNLLVSARNLSLVYVIARPGGEIVWRYEHELDHQHEARMTPPGMPGAGRIMLFDNGYTSAHRYRRSVVLDIDPVRQAVVWRYASERFFSATGGTQQVLANGNVLVTSGRGGRAFEVTRSGRIVWQWTPDYNPMRVARYAYDYCPQLAALGRPVEQPVRTAAPEKYIDNDLSRFALELSTMRVGPRKAKVEVLSKGNMCRLVQIPRGAKMTLGYGVDRSVFDGPVRARRALYSATLQVEGEAEEHRLMEEVVDAGELMREREGDPVPMLSRTIPLQQFSGQTARVCLSLVDEAATENASGFVWAPPSMESSAHLAPSDPTRAAAPLTPEAARLQEEQLKALGYVE